ncbi:hypothetical protein RND59_05570 [Vibrio ruber]|uniref:hypothetical protein n=1 Tax=Vibrio ruber TaxID=184755 RepID=UPI0028933288|nr:hypothetical protein [Vibrio ruber]WNJ96565.1 hypothetical protein RND59_05570 [Vibrio ruber]
MSQPITKEMWKDIEAEMSGYFFDIRFLYKGHEIAVTRVHESESKTSLQVYIDGVIKGVWANEDYTHRPVIIPEVWKLVRKSVFSPAQRKKLIKDLGKRKAKEWFPNLEKVVEFHVPNFSKASVLCRQYKKLEGIELKKAECMETI